MKVKHNSIDIKLVENEICSCNVCYAQNYDSEHEIGERVDFLYYLKIGQQGITLCGKCKYRLIKILIEANA